MRAFHRGCAAAGGAPGLPPPVRQDAPPTTPRRRPRPELWTKVNEGSDEYSDARPAGDIEGTKKVNAGRPEDGRLPPLPALHGLNVVEEVEPRRPHFAEEHSQGGASGSSPGDESGARPEARDRPCVRNADSEGGSCHRGRPAS